MKTKVYIAAPFFSPEQLLKVQEIEKHLAKNEIDFYSPRSEGVLDEMEQEDKMNSRKRIYETNIKRMDECTHMVAWLDDRDTGTIFEVGYFTAQKKPVVQYYEDLSNVSVMLSEGAFAICSLVRAIQSSLNGTYNDYEKIGDTQ